MSCARTSAVFLYAPRRNCRLHGRPQAVEPSRRIVATVFGDMLPIGSSRLSPFRHQHFDRLRKRSLDHASNGCGQFPGEFPPDLTSFCCYALSTPSATNQERNSTSPCASAAVFRNVLFQRKTACFRAQPCSVAQRLQALIIRFGEHADLMAQVVDGPAGTRSPPPRNRRQGAPSPRMGSPGECPRSRRSYRNPNIPAVSEIPVVGHV